MFAFLKDNKYFRNICIITITIIGLFLRLKNLADRELWGDELFSITFMGESLKSALKVARGILQFPGDTLIVYPFYQLFGKNKWGLAIPHIIATIIGFYLLYILCRKYFKTTLAYIITFLTVSFNANLIFHAFEIRPYSVLVTLGIAVFLAMQYIVENKTVSTLKKFLLNSFLFCVISFHLYGSFMIVFLYTFHILFSRREESIRSVILRNIRDYYLGVLFALPVWYYFVSVDKTYLKYLKHPVFEYIHSDPASLFKGIFGNLVAFKLFYVFAAMLPLAFLLPQRDRLKQVMFLFLVVLIPIIFVLFTCIHYQSMFIQRLFVWVMPLFAFLVGWSWDSVFIYFEDKRKQSNA